MTRNHEKLSDANIIFGVLAGTVIGAVAACVVNSSKAQEIKENLYDVYEDTSRKLGFGKRKFSDRFFKYDDSSKDIGLKIGALAGGILGISALIFLTTDSAKGIRKQMAESFENIADKAHSLKDMAHDKANHFEDNISPWIKKAEIFIDRLNQNNSKSRKMSSDQPFDKILDWAVAATQLYQSFKK